MKITPESPPSSSKEGKFESQADSPHAARNALVRYLRRYAIVVHREGLDGMSAEQVVDEIGPPEERESRERMAKENVLSQIQHLTSMVEEVNQDRNIQLRLVGMVGIFLAGIAFFHIRRPSWWKSVLRSFFNDRLWTIISRALVGLAEEPWIWFVLGGTGQLINLTIRNIRKLLAIDAVKKTLNRTAECVQESERVPSAYLEVLTGRKWETVPWETRIV